jgi:PhoPQ-activated pathogenicity-related protein
MDLGSYYIMSKRLHTLLSTVAFAAVAVVALPGSCTANALTAYVQQADTTFAWNSATQLMIGNFTRTHVTMKSQTWRGHVWTHDLQILRPHTVRHPEIAFLYITGDGDGRSTVSLLQTLADRAGAVAAVVTRVPNQPLFDGRAEDALIAYTFDQYVRTGDETWPALFPMTKTAVRAMDTVQAWANREHQQNIEKFVVAGASKRGWTAWLVGAADPRVAAIAPIVFDMLNMKAQTEWAKKVYGRQSEHIADYTDLHLVDQIDTPPMQKLRSWVDPYSYRTSYTIPKLLLLGTNDPYWTVDSLRHYWRDLPEPKLLFQTPNAGHSLDTQATQTLIAFFQMLADKEELPNMEWQMTADGNGTLALEVNRHAKAVYVWTADAPARDFRDAKWSKQPVALTLGSSRAAAEVEKPTSGYRAFLGEVVLTASTGHDYKLSTQVQVVPDDAP